MRNIPYTRETIFSLIYMSSLENDFCKFWYSNNWFSKKQNMLVYTQSIVEKVTLHVRFYALIILKKEIVILYLQSLEGTSCKTKKVKLRMDVHIFIQSTVIVISYTKYQINFGFTVLLYWSNFTAFLSWIPNVIWN